MGTLYLISTPIGNLDDITFRSRKILENSGIFLAEDTRVFKSLLNHLKIQRDDKKIISFHDHNDQRRMEEVISYLDQEHDVYLVSDAGSPMISDPAYPLVKRVIESGHDVSSVPGVSSVMVALELSGLPPSPFTFHGFFPRENKGRSNAIFNIFEKGGTHVFFESPHRIMKTLEYLSTQEADLKLAVCRELTKKFETVYRFLSSDFEKSRQKIICKGEFVVVVYFEQKTKNVSVTRKTKKMALEYLDDAGNTKLLAKILSTLVDEKTKSIYNRLISKNWHAHKE